MAKPEYGSHYQKARKNLLGRPCHICGKPGSDSVDHVPALHKHEHQRAFRLLSAASGSSASATSASRVVGAPLRASRRRSPRRCSARSPTASMSGIASGGRRRG